MSRGPGKIERAIRALFDANPDRVFITDDLVEHCYPEADQRGAWIEKKHTVAVLRAVHKVCARDPNWTERPFSTVKLNEDPHLGLCFYNMDSLESFARAQVFGGDFGRRGAPDHDAIRRILDNDRYRKLMEPGGSWWRHVEMHRAKRDGDTARLAQLNAEQEESLRQIAIKVRNALDR